MAFGLGRLGAFGVWAGARDAEFDIEFGISIWELAKEASLHFALGAGIGIRNLGISSLQVRKCGARPRVARRRSALVSARPAGVMRGP